MKNRKFSKCLQIWYKIPLSTSQVCNYLIQIKCFQRTFPPHEQAVLPAVASSSSNGIRPSIDSNCLIGNNNNGLQLLRAMVVALCSWEKIDFGEARIFVDAAGDLIRRKERKNECLDGINKARRIKKRKERLKKKKRAEHWRERKNIRKKEGK